MRFAAGDLQGSGARVPDRVVQSVSGCSRPGFSDLAFDKNGALWVASLCDGTLAKIDVGQLGGPSENVTPSVVVTLPETAWRIAFDFDGNAWLSMAKSIVRYDASQLAASTREAPALKVDMDFSPGPLAFDASGNLWAKQLAANFVRHVPTQRGSTGVRKLEPSVVVGIGLAALQETMAFDNSGGLWIAYAGGVVARLAPAQLRNNQRDPDSGDWPAPELVFTHPNRGADGALAFFPAPRNLPLYASIPHAKLAAPAR
jgi:ligand-binding sensor domain-containing protein